MSAAAKQRSSAASALAAFAFCALALAIVEVARMIFLWNALSESTRRVARAAAITDYASAASAPSITAAALFNNNGAIPLDYAITRDNLRVDYLTAGMAPALLPACPPQNVINCRTDPAAANCVRFVRVRVCQPGAGSDCTPLAYSPLLAPRALLPATLALPTFSTVRPAGTLGYVAGQSDSCT
jgi:hypothetical protein